MDRGERKWNEDDSSLRGKDLNRLRIRAPPQKGHISSVLFYFCMDCCCRQGWDEFLYMTLYSPFPVLTVMCPLSVTVWGQHLNNILLLWLVVVLFVKWQSVNEHYLKEEFCGSMKSQISHRVNVPILPLTLKRNYVCIFLVELILP